MKAIGERFEAHCGEAKLSKALRAQVLGRIYSMFKRPMSTVTEQDAMAAIARIHREAAIDEASIEELYAEINRRCSLDSEPAAAIEDAWTVNATFRTC